MKQTTSDRLAKVFIPAGIALATLAALLIFMLHDRSVANRVDSDYRWARSVTVGTVLRHKADGRRVVVVERWRQGRAMKAKVRVKAVPIQVVRGEAVAPYALLTVDLNELEY